MTMSGGAAPPVMVETADLDRARNAGPMKVRRRWGRRLLTAFAALVFLWLFAPLINIVIFTFNKPAGRRNLSWNEFTLENWSQPFKDTDLTSAFMRSLLVSAVAVSVALVLGSLMAIALSRYRFTGSKVTEIFLVLPLTTPEIVLGASLYQLFLGTNTTLGFSTIVIAHIMFCLSFVVVTVKARLQSLDPRLEEAAQDLYAGPSSTFWRVTFPLVLPGIVSAALLSFSLSFDDFIITNFVSGDTNTFPKFVYVSYLRGIPAQANVIGFSLFLFAVLLVILGQVIGSRRRSAA